MYTENSEEKLAHFMTSLQAAYDKALDQNSLQELQTDFLKQLERHKEAILLKAMGFDYKYTGNWAVDHCNGRSGESILGDRIRNAAQHALDSFILDNNTGINLSNIILEHKAQIEIAVREQFKKELHYKVIDMVKKEVSTLAQNTVNQLLEESKQKSLNILDFIKTIAEQ